MKLIILLFFLLAIRLVTTNKADAQEVTYQLYLDNFTSLSPNTLAFNINLRCETGGQLLPSQIQAVININSEFKNGGDILTPNILYTPDPNPQPSVNNYANYISILINQLSGQVIQQGATMLIARVEIQTSANSFGDFKWTWKNSVGIYTKVFHYVNSQSIQITNPDWHLPIELLTAVSGNETAIPTGFKLAQNYNNPFNPTTIIEYSIPKESFVVLKVYDMGGKEIQTLVEQKHNRGNFKVIFDGKNLSSGTYFYNLVADNILIDSKIMILQK